MTVRLALILVATAVAPGSLNAQDAAPAAREAPPPELQKLAQSCSARKFETTVEVTANGKKGSRKLTLCGKEGQSDAEWTATLKDAAEKIAASKMSPAAKAQAIAALDAEIAKVEAASKVAIAAPVGVLPAADAPPLADTPRYSALPAIPPPPAASKPILAAPASASGTAALASAPAPASARLTIKCAERGERGDGHSCTFLERDTLLSIRADADLPDGATLRFIRRGDARGEVAVEPMKAGQIVRARLPAPLCAGVATSKAEIQIFAGAGGAKGSPAATLGPYGLRC